MNLRAYVGPEHYPGLEKVVNVLNKKTVRIRGGTVTFYVTPNFVVAVTKVVKINDKWDDVGNYQTTVHEIRPKIEQVLQ